MLPRLSLCMIVRDESELLPAFLERVDGLWDELVAVDTGSRDATPEILLNAGAKVVRAVWTDDFSAARNASLQHATGDWILVLDADEMLTGELAGEIRALVGDPSVGAATLRMRNRLPGGQVSEVPLLRLFRRDPEVQYRFRVHEDASESVERMLQRRHQGWAHLRGAVEHLGYSRERAASRQKKQRDLYLLDLALIDNPGDLYCHFKRIEVARFWGDTQALDVVVREAQVAIDLADPSHPRSAQNYANLLAAVARERGRDNAAAALDWMESCPEPAEATAELSYVRGELCERANRGGAAEAHYRQALAASSGSRNQYAVVRPSLGLCRLALGRGDLAGAKAHAQRALGENPFEREALLVLAAMTRASGGGEAVERFASGHLQKFGYAVSFDLALSDEALTSGDIGAARAALDRASSASPTPAESLDLARLWIRASEMERAKNCAFSALAADPRAGIAVLVSNMALGQSTDLTLDLDLDAANRALEEWSREVLAHSDPELVGTFLRMVPTVAGPFPWLEHFCAQQVEARVGLRAAPRQSGASLPRPACM